MTDPAQHPAGAVAASSHAIRRLLIRGVLSNYAGKAVSVGVWFVLTPVLLHRLGPQVYGIWVLVGAVASYGYLLDLGIGGAVVKYVAEHMARGDAPGAGRVVSTALWLYLGLGALAVAASFAAAALLPSLLGVPLDQRGVVAEVLVLTGATVGLTIAFSPALNALAGLQRYDLYNAVNAGGSVLTAAATAAVLLAGGGIVAVVGVTLPVTLVMRLAAVRMLRAAAPELRYGPRLGERSLVPRILAFSSASFALQASARLNSKSDEFVIAATLQLGAVAPFAIARKLGELAQLTAEQFLKVLVPAASALDGVGDGARLRRMFVASSRLTLAVMAPVAIVLCVLPGAVLSAWVGPDYARHGGLVVILTLSGLAGTSQWAAGAVLQGMNRHRFVAATWLAAGVANVALSLFLVRRLGLTGVALGTLVPTCVAAFGVVLPFAARELGLGLREIAREVWVPGLLPALPAAAVVYALQRAVAVSSLAGVAGLGAAAAAVYAAGYLSFGSASAERALFLGVLRRAGAWLSGRRTQLPGTRGTPQAPGRSPRAAGGSGVRVP